MDGECAAHGYRGTVDWSREFPALLLWTIAEHAGDPTGLAAPVKVAGCRWRIEEAFQGAKGLCGLDEHQVRSWRYLAGVLGTSSLTSRRPAGWMAPWVGSADAA
jgi:hypothetical protein